MTWGNVWHNAGLIVMVGHDFDRLDAIKCQLGFDKSQKRQDLRERFIRVLRKHRDHDTVHDLNFRLVCGSNLHEDIPRIHGNLRVITVDDRWQRADSLLRIIDDRVHGGVTDDMEESTQVFIFLLNGQKSESGPSPTMDRHTS